MHTMALILAAYLATAGIAHAQYYPQQRPTYRQQPPPATLRYNPYSGQFDLTYRDSQLQYNPHQNTWQYTRPGARPQYNPFTGQFEFPR